MAYLKPKETDPPVLVPVYRGAERNIPIFRIRAGTDVKDVRRIAQDYMGVDKNRIILSEVNQHGYCREVKDVSPSFPPIAAGYERSNKGRET